MLTVAGSRQRQGRLLDVMRRRRLDAVVVGMPRHVYYLSSFLPHPLHEAALVLFADGRSTLVAPNVVPSTPVAADEVLTYEANRFGTLVQEQPASIAQAVLPKLVGETGLDASAVSSQIAMGIARRSKSIEPDLWQLRRRKDADELALMRKALACAEAMYARAKDVVEPGVSELRVFTELNAAAVEAAGEPLWAHLGNDFACGVPGGPARARAIEAGELYILDLGPAYRGYFSDTARTFAVDRRPTDAQLAAQEAVASTLGVVEALARPGARCVGLFEAASEHLRSLRGKGMTHHLGHGVGLQPHEYPHLNPKWDDVLLEGEVFSAEPGVYDPMLRSGVRLENQYLVTANGVENLINFPLGL